MVTRSLTKLWLTIVVGNDDHADGMLDGRWSSATCFLRAKLARIWRAPRGSPSSTWSLPRDSNTPSWRAERTFIILLLLVLDLKVVRLQRLLCAAFQSCGVVCAQSHARFSPQVWLAAAADVNPPELLEVIEIRPACFGGAFLGDASCGNRPGSWAPAASNTKTVAALLCREASGSFYPSILSFWAGRCW